VFKQHAGRLKSESLAGIPEDLRADYEAHFEAKNFQYGEQLKADKVLEENRATNALLTHQEALQILTDGVLDQVKKGEFTQDEAIKQFRSQSESLSNTVQADVPPVVLPAFQTRLERQQSERKGISGSSSPA